MSKNRRANPAKIALGFTLEEEKAENKSGLTISD